MRRIRLGVLLFLWLTISVTALAQSSGKIVFTKSEYTREGFEQAMSRKRGSNKGWWELSLRHICTINPDGSGLEQLTEDGVSYHPEWSLDGQKIAFLSGPPPKVNLYVMNADGANRQKLISGQRNIYDFDWSPDGTAILAYVEGKDSRDPEETWIVAVSDGGSTKRMGSSEWAKGWNHWDTEGASVLNPKRRLIDGLPEGVAWPQWSPDNNYLAFLHEGVLAIANVAIIGTLEDWRASNLEPPSDRMGDWSPDSGKILFFIKGNVCSTNIDGTEAINLSMAGATDACWNPNGSRIAYTATDGRKRNTEIFIMNADGTDHVQITNTNYFHMDVDWQ